MDSIEPGEAELWSRGLTGDSEAFGLLFDRHKNRVFRHAYRQLLDRHDAEDVTGTAFLELWRRRESVRLVDGSALPWLLVATTNAALNTRRTTRRYRSLLGRLPRSVDHPSAEQEALERTDALPPELQTALRQLDDTDRGLVVLVMLEGYSPTEAAEVLRLAPGTARTRLSRLRARLRVVLDRPGEASGPPESTSPDEPASAPAALHDDTLASEGGRV
ncbi:sigma-70 family RNA polymerase sigma factor [Herbiconiux sp. 11R-BC]|uniref:RNA polymerase sigma factor n=1 Tax=Herbiconiux sp. 11R-BC TaxID=3111637 RepID=UPI003BFFD3C2